MQAELRSKLAENANAIAACSTAAAAVGVASCMQLYSAPTIGHNCSLAAYALVGSARKLHMEGRRTHASLFRGVSL